MGRNNRSRKRKNAMDRVKRERNAKKELARLKKTLGIIDDAEMKDAMAEVTIVKTAEQIKKEKEAKEEKALIAEIKDEEDPGENIEVINEKTQKVHVYNTKTMRDQYGTLPPWKRPRRTERKMRKVNHSRKKAFKQNWCHKFVPID